MSTMASSADITTSSSSTTTAARFLHASPTIPLPSTAAHTIPLLLPHRYDLSDQSNTTPSKPIHPRNARLHDKIQVLNSQIRETEENLSATLNDLRRFLPASPFPTNALDTNDEEKSLNDPEVEVLAQAQALVTKYIRLLHKYNEIKDIGMGFMGLIADRDGKRLGDVTAEYGIEEGD